MPSRKSRSVLHRAAAAALSGLLLAGLFIPATAAAGPGTPPALVNDTITTDEGMAASGNVLTNDSNPGEGTLAVTGFTAIPETVGTLSIDADGAYTFTPAGGFHGTHETSYTAENAKHERSALILITVNALPHAPVANDDDVTVVEDTATDLTSAVLANDTDEDLDTLTVTDASGATGGSVDVTSGVLTFTPDDDLCGDDAGSFDYTISDGQEGSDAAHATVDITCENDNPVANEDQVAGTEDQDVVITASDLVANDTDVEDDALTVTGVGNPSNGTVSLESGSITFTPDADVCGEVGFDYDLSDGNGGTATGHVVIDLECTADDPVAVDDEVTGTEDTDVVIDAAELVANDSDVDEDTLTVDAVGEAQGGSVVLDAGTITFTPDADLCGDDAASFEYSINDGNGHIAGAVVTIDLECANDAPVAVDDSATVDENSPAADHDVVANDTDAEGDELTLESVDVDGAEGTATIVENKVQFTPAADFSGTATVTYVVTDGTDSDTGELVITVSPVGPGDVTPPQVTAPTIAFGAGRVDQTAPIVVSWSGTDSESGIAGYEVQVSINGGTFQDVYEGNGTSVQAFYGLRRTLVFRARATDNDGNTSDWVTAGKRKIVAHQSGGPRVEYKGTWRKKVDARASGAGYSYTTTKGSSVRLDFRGRAVLFVSLRGPDQGKVKVIVDGTSIGRFNLAREATRFGAIVARQTWSGNDDHRIRIVADSGKRVVFDTYVVIK